MLVKLNEAITTGDQTKLGALIDPSATPRFRAAFETEAANIGAKVAASKRGNLLRYKTFRYWLGSADAEFVVPQELQQRLEDQGSSDTWFAPIKLDYALGGESLPGLAEDDITVSTPFALARYDDDWKIVGDSTVLQDVQAPAPMIWSYPELRARDVTTSGGDSVVLSYPGTDAAVATIARELPDAVVAVTNFWGQSWARRAAVVATGTAAQFSGLASADSPVGAAAAATIYASLDSAEKTASGQRVVLTPTARTLPAPALAVVLRHELTHVAVRGVTVSGAPLWITEGMPEYVGRKGTYQRFDDVAPNLAAVLRSGDIPARLPDDRDFAVDQNTALVAYQSAWSLAAYVAEKYGPDRLKALYLGVAGADKVPAQDLAIVNTLRVSRAQFVAQWQDWLRKQVR
ncbi:hypothetical protein GOEFS_009_00540 [Gordonia effusa NBRC 100432]|uniref:Peptidase MA-like domain-containing protein n=1 Tax=Gordonia effusa NBRC 100432 TaxID=1077974 RepID=H0QV34_9ACTN|nr:hypothetical protein GOEFS_009_00540 [Gordonia effusa NBRC 100432]